MPRPFMTQNNAVSTTQNSIINLNMNQNQKTSITLSREQKYMLDKKLRKPRSEKYMNALRQLDAGGHVHNKHLIEQIINVIKEELPEIDMGGYLQGYVSKCYLGDPYEVHTLDFKGNIIEHYERGRALPSGMEKARGIAITGDFEFIEVYTDCCRAIDARGRVSVF